MCGRIVRLDIDEINWEHLRVRWESMTRLTPDLRRYFRRYNIAPTQEDILLRPAADGEREVVPSRWGLIPSWSEDRSVASKWTGERKERMPWYFHAADDGPLAVAGLWTTWRDPATEQLVTSHTIITTRANEMMYPCHHRMPVILRGAGLGEWLNPAITERSATLHLLQPPPEDTLTAYQVSTLVNDVHHDGPELIEPAA